MKPLLVLDIRTGGEDLGGRMCLILGISPREYLQRYERVNLCRDKWSMSEASASAGRVLHDPGDFRVLVLLGSKVCSAFGVGFVPYTVIERSAPHPRRRLVVLPHPSGLSRLWNEPGSYERARRVLRVAGAL